MKIDGEEVHNKFLLALPKSNLTRLHPFLRAAPLAKGQAIARANKAVPYIYFVNRGFISMIKTMRDRRSVEVGGIGIEGFTSPGTLLAYNSAILDAVVQVPGIRFRIERNLLRREVSQRDEFIALAGNYTRFVLDQIIQTAACKAHAASLPLGREEGHKDFFPLVGRDTETIIGHLDQDAAFRVTKRR